MHTGKLLSQVVEMALRRKQLSTKKIIIELQKAITDVILDDVLRETYGEYFTAMLLGMLEQPEVAYYLKPKRIIKLIDGFVCCALALCVMLFHAMRTLRAIGCACGCSRGPGTGLAARVTSSLRPYESRPRVCRTCFAG